MGFLNLTLGDDLGSGKRVCVKEVKSWSMRKPVALLVDARFWAIWPE